MQSPAGLFRGGLPRRLAFRRLAARFNDDEVPAMTDIRARIIRALKTVLIVLVVTTGIMLFAEACATYSIERSASVKRDPSGQSRYVMRIGKFPWSHRSVTPLNSQGYPDMEFAALPSKGDCRHIVFAGDSFIFGDGVDRDSNFVSHVRRWTEERQPNRCIRIFNLGVRGTTINRQAQAVRETLETLQPDVVIVGQYQNDLTDLTTPVARADSTVEEARKVRWTDVRDRFGTANLNLVRMLLYHGFAIAIRRDVHYDLLRHWSVLADSSRAEDAKRLKQIYTESYGSFIDEMKNRGVAVGVIVIPSKFDVLAGRFPEESFFLELARQHAVPVLNLFPLLDEKRAPYAYLLYDGHFNEHGNRLVANAVYEWLYQASSPPFPTLVISPAMAIQATANPVR